MASDIESDLHDTVDWGRRWFVDFNSRKAELVSFDCSGNCGAIVKVDGSVLDEKLSFKVMALSFSSVLDWGLLIVTLAKTPRTLKHFSFTDVSFL